MNIIERLSLAVRHHALLGEADWIWTRLRPFYHHLIVILARNGGLERTINGTDLVRVLPRFRQMGEVYEPQVWSCIMRHVQPGDIIADVGAFIGLYTIALAKRVGTDGRVIAFEPDPASFGVLKAHVALNSLQERVELVPALVSSGDGNVPFAAGKSSQSSISYQLDDNAIQVHSIRLDTYFDQRRLDILKIDVEGFEEEVLRSGECLLTDRYRNPRLIYIEVHPYAWPVVGTTSDSLLGYLQQCGYQVIGINDRPVERVRHYGEILAVKCTL